MVTRDGEGLPQKKMQQWPPVPQRPKRSFSDERLKGAPFNLAYSLFRKEKKRRERLQNGAFSPPTNFVVPWRQSPKLRVCVAGDGASEVQRRKPAFADASREGADVVSIHTKV